MIVKVSQVAAEFRRVSNKQMADTTKRTIKENVSISNQLQKMSEKVIEAIQENDDKKIKVIKFEIYPCSIIDLLRKKFLNNKSIYWKIMKKSLPKKMSIILK